MAEGWFLLRHPNCLGPWPGTFFPAVAISQAGDSRGTMSWPAAGLEGGGAALWAGRALLRAPASPVGPPGTWGSWGPGEKTC